MAGGKETPRQKMIGMMYLVLTALLALNVSKSILDAFVAIEENMQQANLTELARGNEKKANLEEVAEDKSNPGAQEKAKLLLQAVEKIDKLTAKQIQDIDALKFEILETSGEDMKSVGTKESIVTMAYNPKMPLKPTRMNLEHVQAKDQYDVPMAIMIGVDTDVKKPTGKGMELWNSLKKFRNELVEAVAGSQVASDTSGKASIQTKFKYKAPDIKEFEDDTKLAELLRADIKKQ